MQLALKNLLRWVREYAISWGLLSVIYSFTLSLLLQTVAGQILDQEPPLKLLWPLTLVILLVPALVDFLPLPSIPIRLPSRIRGLPGLALLYLRHELRRGQTYAAIALSLAAGLLLSPDKRPLWVLLSLLPAQRAFYSIFQWRRLALLDTSRGATALMDAMLVSQLVQVLILWLAAGVGTTMSFQDWFSLGPAFLGGVIGSCAVAMEGDSGRPWVVNFIALASGLISGYLCLAFPWVVLLGIYLYSRMRAAVAERLYSVEHFDEDTLIR